MSESPQSALPLPASTASLDNEQLIRAALNSSVDEFLLGDRSFKITDLPYDDYISFIGHLTPLIDTVIQKISGAQGVTIPGIELRSSSFSAANILSLCGKDLPAMAHIICRQTDPTITLAEVKKLAGRPTILVTLIMRQIQQNEIIKDFADFFAQVLSLLKPVTASLGQST